MITKKLTNKVHDDLRSIIQEYMNLNDGTNQTDHTIHDLWCWLSYKIEGYSGLNQEEVRALNKEKQQYFGLLQCGSSGRAIREFRENVRYLDQSIERKSTNYIKTKKYRTNKAFNNKQQ